MSPCQRDRAKQCPGIAVALSTWCRQVGDLAAKFRLRSRQIFPYAEFHGGSSGAPCDEIRQTKQVPHADIHAPGADLLFEIGLDPVGPLDRNGMNVARGVLTQDPSPGDVGLLADATQAEPSERMERVGDPHKLLICDRNTCS